MFTYSSKIIFQPFVTRTKQTYRLPPACEIKANTNVKPMAEYEPADCLETDYIAGSWLWFRTIIQMNLQKALQPLHRDIVDLSTKNPLIIQPRLLRTPIFNAVSPSLYCS